MSQNSEHSELPSLPMHSVNRLHPTTINIARQVDAMVALLVKEQGFAHFAFDIVRGKLGILHIDRSFRMIED